MQTRHELMNSISMALSHYNHCSYSKITKAPPSEDSSEGCPAWSMSSLTAVLPESPSPTCSAAASSSSPRDSQVPIESSDARNLQRQTSCNEIEKWMENAKTFSHFRHPFLHNNNHFKAPDQEVSSLISSPVACANTIFGASEAGSLNNGRHKLLSRHKPYHAFLDELKRQELQAQIDAWKKAKYQKLVHKLERKEAVINEWELKNTKKAMEEMKNYESKLEIKRSKALAKTNKRISRVKNEASRKKSKARRSTIDEISAVSKYYEKIRATKSFLLLELRKFF